MTTTAARRSGASTRSAPRTDLDLTIYELRDLANDLEKLSGVDAPMSGSLTIEVNTDPGVKAVVRVRNGSVRVVSFK